MEESATLRGLPQWDALDVAQELLPDLRQRYGADLVYAVTRGELDTILCGAAYLRDAGFDSNLAGRHAATGFIRAGCFTSSFHSYSTLAHEVGHNLGLVHDIQDPNAGTPFVEYGRAYATRPAAVSAVYRSTIMGVGGSEIPQFSSARRKWRETISLGDPTADASRALLYTIEDASNYAPTKVRDPSPVAACTDTGTSACLSRGRFQVGASYWVNGVEGQAKERDAMLGEDGAIFYFFDAGNPELLVKVVDGCWLNDHYWVFGSAATDLGYTIRIRHQIASGDDPDRSAAYHVEGGVIERRRAGGERATLPGAVIADTYAFPCSGSGTVAAAPLSSARRVESETTAIPARKQGSAGDRDPLLTLGSVGQVPARAADSAPTEYGCFPGGASACLDTAGRFSVAAGVSGERYLAGKTAVLLGDNAALFYFFNPDNPELLLKVVDGCAINGHYWVFGSAATDLDYWVTVGDYASGRDDHNFAIRSNQYFVSGGVVYGSGGAEVKSLGVIADTFAFPCS